MKLTLFVSPYLKYLARNFITLLMRFNLSPYNFSFFDSAFHILILWRVKKVAEKEIFFSEFRSRFADQLFAEQAAEEVILVSPDFNPKMPFTRFHSVAFQKSVKQ